MNWLPSITILLLFACLVAFEYIKDLRRDLKASKLNADTGWRLYEGTHRELLVAQGKPVPSERTFPEDSDERQTKPVPEFMGGIGITAIRNREQYEREQTERKSEPRFASPGTLNPDLADIQSAAREATNGGPK